MIEAHCEGKRLLVRKKAYRFHTTRWTQSARCSRALFASAAESDYTVSLQGFPSGLGGYTASSDCAQERGVITFGLICIRLGERSDRPVECIICTQVAADLCRIARAGVRASQGPTAELAVAHEASFAQARDAHGYLHIPQLANIEVDGCEPGPAEK